MTSATTGTASPGGILDGIVLFEAFSPEERAAVASRGRVFDAPAGTVLMREGDSASSLYVLLDGTVRVVRDDPFGGQVEVGFRRSGDCFGEMALIDGGSRSASVIAATPVTVFELERDLFLALISPSPDLLAKLLRELSRMIREVSERVVREDLERRTRIAESALARQRAITQAVTGLAHELNTPLGVCVTAASHLQDLARPGNGPLSTEELREPATLLDANLARAVDLVEAFSAIAACQTAEPLEALDLRRMAEEAASLFAIQNPDLPLAISVAPGAPCPWIGYAPHLERVLHQLFANAAAHGYGGGAGEVEVAVEPAALDAVPAWSLTVRDNGAGIPAGNLPTLTDAFFTTARHRGHKGLGLAVVFNTVTGPLGGRLAVNSMPGAGTSVTITVPQEL
ncbi:cyclic nucleotide-binding protein [Azospirillum sp. TSH100]|uniref:sensor histidine kinase n=1 Tax=Azospirillum sp. TSH100 TaxID=652764 RepID=UPI000D611134|nr:cyclic nucleotide-binding domain-containing protein [Azospirillum sp. TSH100]PWC89079.1 cyclic nucleotide-binding protein [Azospirillum sp. TSH100]QCG87130.1 cyclic nucleotide-binding domain-containing protein [Azospirillum sp. TSH100]